MDTLPEEILFVIFSLLGIDTLRKCAPVCRTWCRVSRSDELWKEEYERLVLKEPSGVCVRTQTRKQRRRWPAFVPDPYWISCQKILLYFFESFLRDNWCVDVKTGRAVLAITYLSHRLHDPRASDEAIGRLPERYCVHRMRYKPIPPRSPGETVRRIESIRELVRRAAEREHLLHVGGVSKRTARTCGRAGRRCALHVPFSHLE